MPDLQCIFRYHLLREEREIPSRVSLLCRRLTFSPLRFFSADTRIHSRSLRRRRVRDFLSKRLEKRAVFAKVLANCSKADSGATTGHASIFSIFLAIACEENGN